MGRTSALRDPWYRTIATRGVASTIVFYGIFLTSRNSRKVQ